MPKVIPPQDNPQSLPASPEQSKPIIKLSPELFEKIKKLEHYMDLIWKGEYSPKASVEIIWRLFNEPKKQG